MWVGVRIAGFIIGCNISDEREVYYPYPDQLPENVPGCVCE